LASGNEIGTAPGDRHFRPDVQGLRAIAIAVVVLYHAGVPFTRGGYVGVDVFFVISGFVITGALLRERLVAGTTSILGFYVRRVRRILPASTLVILITVVGAYLVLGPVGGNGAADAGRWAAVFLANFHFARTGTDYFLATAPPSPLLNYWSLAVEEQFYAVYPALFVLALRTRHRRAEASLTLWVGLATVAAASFALSVVQTSTQPTTAYFSPFTRAWELAIGALVALATTSLRHLDARVAAALSWVGLGSVAMSAVAYGTGTPYPGAYVALPVLGTAAIIAGGAAAPAAGAERLLGLSPFQWLGARSYPLYLWHWPLLVIAAERVGKSSLGLGSNLLLVGVAIGLSMVSYRFVEQPVRRSRLGRRTTLIAAGAAVGGTVVLLSLAIAVSTTPYTGSAASQAATAPSEPVILAQVAAAPSVRSLPPGLQPTLTDAAADTVLKFPGFSKGCISYPKESSVPICLMGDAHGAKLMVVYGDSHASMWIPALDPIARKAGWRLVVLSKLYCPASLVVVTNPPGWGQPGQPYQVCNAWHRWVLGWLARNRPNLLVITQRDGSFYRRPSADGITTPAFTTSRWQAGLKDLLVHSERSSGRVLVLGDTPLLDQSPPVCLSIHPDDLPACSTPAVQAVSPYLASEKAAASQSGAGYINPTPWFCSATCTAVVDHYIVDWDQDHVTATYARHLSKVLNQAIGLPPPGP
jgi:peptidoglycan/LPS O-acetylase OafA/YrhL